MAVYPSDFELDVVLKDGQVVQLRPIRPEDAEEHVRFLARVGPRSLYQRFFRVRGAPTPDEVRHFTTVDYEDRMALVVVHEGEIVAVGRYDVVEETPVGKVAEVAFLVEDGLQGRGIGTLLLQHLTVYARLHGVGRFQAFVLADNMAMLRLFRNSGYRLTRELAEGIYSIDFPIELSPEARAAEWEHERRAVAASLVPLLYPRSVAVVGAGRDETSIGGRLFRNLVTNGFLGVIYPVNPHADVILSRPVYASVLDIPAPVDLAIIAVPAASVLEVADECGRRGVRGIVVISAGFGETGEEGRRREEGLVRIVRRHGMRMIGPNCMGIINTDPVVRLDGQFAPGFPPAGNVGMSSQSGALGIAILDEAERLGIGLSTFLSLGNTADVTVNDALLYWEDDPETDVILLYVESFGSARRFGRISRRIARRKPIVVVKAGRSPVGARAVASHTGSLASSDIAVDALFRQSGVVRTETLSEMFDVASLLASQPLPAGRRVAVLSNAGGPAILAADALEANGLELPDLDKGVRERLSGHLSPDASTRNPVDMVASASPDQYRACLGILLEEADVDAVIVVHIPTAPGTSRPVAQAIAAGAAASELPVLAVLMGSEHERRGLDAGIRRIPVYPYPEQAARALTAAVRYREWRDRPEGELVDMEGVDRAEAGAVVHRALDRVDGEGWLDGSEISRLFAAYGIPWIGGEVVATAEEAVAAAGRTGGPVVLKVASPTVTHKSDVGGVVLGVEGSDAVRAAFSRVTAAVPDAVGALVQRYVPTGHEVIVGMSEDPLFGPLILFGMGGVLVELIHDVTFRINPLTDVDVDEMLTELASSRLLWGYRGAPGGDVGALRDLLLRISLCVEQNPEIVEMDLNPVKVLEVGVWVVDARVRVRPVPGAVLPAHADVPGRLL